VDVVATANAIFKRNEAGFLPIEDNPAALALVIVVVVVVSDWKMIFS